MSTSGVTEPIQAQVSPVRGRRVVEASMPRVFGGPRKRLMVKLLFNGLGQAVAAFSIAWLTRRALTAADFGAADGAPLDVLGGLALAGLAVLGFQVLERVDAERLGQDYVMKVRLRLFGRIAAAPSRSRKNVRFGLTMNRMITDLNALKNWVSVGVARMAVAAVSVAGSLAALSYFNPLSALVGAGLVAACVGGGVLSTPVLRGRVREARRRRGELAGNLGEKVFAMLTVVHFGQTRREWRRLRSQSRRLSNAMVNRVKVSAVLRALPHAAMPVSVAAVCGLAATGRLSGTELIPTLLLLGMITASLRHVAQAWDYRLSFEEAHRRLTAILSQPRVREAKDAIELGGDGPVSIAFKNVRVAGVLNGVSAAAEAGERVLVTGSTGSGKSTLMALAARLFDPDRGRVLLDGQRLRALSHASNHRAVQLVSPKLPLLRGTVADNIAFGLATDDSDAIARVASLCALDKTSTLLPEGLDSRVEEKGQNLPEGLRARIALARAVAAGPRLLLIDDPVFATDSDARTALSRVSAASDATVLMTGAVEQAAIRIDRVWCLEEGQITETIPPGRRRESTIHSGLRVLK